MAGRYSRAGDTKGKQIARAHPVDSTLRDAKMLSRGRRDGREGQPLQNNHQFRVQSAKGRENTYIPAHDNIQQYQLREPHEPALVDPIDRPRGRQIRGGVFSAPGRCTEENHDVGPTQAWSTSRQAAQHRITENRVRTEMISRRGVSRR